MIRYLQLQTNQSQLTTSCCNFPATVVGQQEESPLTIELSRAELSWATNLETITSDNTQKLCSSRQDAHCSLFLFHVLPSEPDLIQHYFDLFTWGESLMSCLSTILLPPLLRLHLYRFFLSLSIPRLSICVSGHHAITSPIRLGSSFWGMQSRIEILSSRALMCYFTDLRGDYCTIIRLENSQEIIHSHGQSKNLLCLEIGKLKNYSQIIYTFCRQ